MDQFTIKGKVICDTEINGQPLTDNSLAGMSAVEDWQSLTDAQSDSIDSIKNNPLYKKLYDISINSNIKTNTLYPDLQLNNLEQKTLIELFNTTFDNGFNQIISDHNGLKYYDSLYFCLYIIGLDEKHISAVTGKTYNAIWNRTKKIQKIFGSDKKIKDIIKKKLKY